MKFGIFAILLVYMLCPALQAEESIQSQEIQQEAAAEDVKEIQGEVEKELAETELLAEQARKTSKDSDSATERSLADFLLELQTYRAELLEVKLVQVKAVDTSIQQMKEKSESLKQLEYKLKNKAALTSVDLSQATEIWRDIADDTISRLFEATQLEAKKLPTLPTGISLTGEKFSELREKVSKSMSEIETQQQDLQEDIKRLIVTEKGVRSSLLLNSGRVRSSLMKVMISKNRYSPWAIAENDPRDYIREFKVVPYRFIATFTQKYFEFNSLSLQGLKGWLEIAKQLVLLLFVFGLPFIIFKAFNAFSLFLENTRKQIITKSKLDFRSRTKLAIWIGRVNPYLPWVFTFIAIGLAEEMLFGTILEPLALVLPYFSLYAAYRAFRIAFGSVLGRVLLSKNLDSVRDKIPRVEVTTQNLSRLFFIEIVLLRATEDAVRQALIYSIIFDLVIVVNLLVVMFEAKKWKSELLNLSQAWLKESWVDKIGSRDRPRLDLAICPLLFIGDIIYLLLSWLFAWFSQFEVGKKLSSEIFKKRLEEAAEENAQHTKGVPEEYRKLFESIRVVEDTRVQLSRTPLQKCLLTIESWLFTGAAADLIMLYGNFGIGKTTMLDALEEKLNEKLSIRRIQINNRICRADEFYKMISELLGTEIHSPADLEAHDKKLGKTLVIIDDIHNLYLNEEEGLSGYRSLIDVSSLQLENIFWCFTCNERSLVHLNGLFGASHFLGEHIELMSWTDAEIQDLILKRHRQSQYKLKFDQIISAVHKGEILEASSSLEVQFFRMLWGQSRGNPKTAQELWLTATDLTRKNAIKVSVPDFTNSRDLNEFSDEALLLFASIVKHENITYEDLKNVSNMKDSAMKQAIKLGEDGIILQKISSNRWRVHPKAQYVVHAQLAGRNLIYG